jgi:hypothetical protein
MQVAPVLEFSVIKIVVYIVVIIVSGKTDVFRRGNNVVIAKTNGKACPVSWLLRYISLDGDKILNCQVPIQLNN